VLLVPLVVPGPSGAVVPPQPRDAGRGGVVRVLHFGDSHTGAAAIQAVLRGALQQAGDGGPGYVLPWAQSPASLQAGRTPGWLRLTAKPIRSEATPVVGLGGAALEARHAGERAWFSTSGSRLRAYFLRQPGGGRVTLRVDGEVVGSSVLASAAPGVEVLAWGTTLARRPHRVEIATASAGPVRVLGVSLEGDTGTAYSPLWINGAQATWLLRLPESVLAGLVRAEAPDAIVLAFGTNEACDGLFDAAAYEHELGRLLGVLRGAAPQAALVLAAPPDAGPERVPPAALAAVVEAQRRLARAWSAGFVDVREAMGGAGSMERWQHAGLAAADHVHFTSDGYREIGRHVTQATLLALGRAAPLLTTVAPAAVLPPVWLPGTATPPGSRAPASHSVYLFRTTDGRLIMTDDPSFVAGESGQWVGSHP
jgi:lysophospholipase L1-like esterase